ncbi:MAG TPA: hypothetical protein VI356_12785 [Myxococcales bacterium]
MTTSKSLRFALMVALAAACGAPDVPQSPPPPPTTSAVFDPLTGNIPLPNDLALAQIPATLPAAQQDLLRAFLAQGGFPNDQEVPVTISFQTTTVAADGSTSNAAPDLDPASLNPGTLVVFLATPQGAGTAPLDPVQPADYVKGTDRGTLTLHHKGRTPWPPGQYIVALRGGPNGVKTTAGNAVVASPTFFLIAQGEKLDTEQNLALLRAQTGSTAAAKAAAAQLQAIIAQYSCAPGDTACLAAGGKSPPEPGSAFAAVDQVFPHQQAAVMTTFRVAPVAGAQVQLDAGRGLLPLPIDLLRDPRPASASCAACGHITAQAACALASGNFNAATGACTDAKGNPNAAAVGIQTLDGFSTTGPIIAQVSDLIIASTVTASTVQLWNLANPAAPVKVDATTYLTEPAEVVQSGLSNAIVLQPAGATAGDPTSVFRTRPLAENTDYAVIISDGVKDKTGKPLAAGTVAKILQFTHPTVDANGNSQLAGIDNATAGALEIMRQKLAPALQLSGLAGHVAMAYTFKTQSFLSVAAQLGALPYTTPVTTVAPLATPTLYCGTAAGAAGAPANPACATAPTVASAFSRYGMPPTLPQSNVGFIVEATVPTFNKLQCNAGDTTCTDTGAFTPATVQPVAEPIVALVAVPPPPYPAAGGTTCTPDLTVNPPVLCTIPLAVFHHGLGRGRGDMLAIADTLNKAGIAVASIDAAKHGDRSFCKADAECATGAHCVPEPALASEGDAPGPTPGVCRNGTTPTSPRADFKRSAACPNPACTNESAVPVASSNFLIGTNFFRTRDTQRQDIIDQSQLVRVLSPNPACQLGAPPTDAAHTCANRVLPIALGVQIDPGQIWFVGQSLGSIEGVVDVASNPRINEAAFNVGGGTIVDVFTTSPAFASATNQLLQAIGIQPGTPQFLQFLVVAKTILDPADPVNYAPHLTRDPLPNLLRDPTGKTPQATKDIFTQVAFCDQVVPNPFNFILDTTAHTGPTPIDQGFGGPGNLQVYAKGTTVPDLTACPAPTSGLPPPSSAVSHGFLLDFADAAITATAQDYVQKFLLSPTGTVDKSLVVLP